MVVGYFEMGFGDLPACDGLINRTFVIQLHRYMNPDSKTSKPRDRLKYVCRGLILVGNSLTVLGCVGILLGILGLFDMEIFSLGLSSGIRIIGTVAIAGCLLSAIGYGISDYTH